MESKVSDGYQRFSDKELADRYREQRENCLATLRELLDRGFTVRITCMGSFSGSYATKGGASAGATVEVYKSIRKDI